MKISKKTISYGVTLSKNYNTVRVDESIEVDCSDGFDNEAFNIMKQELKDRVLKQAREELVKVTDKDKSETPLLGGNTEELVL